MRSAVHFAQLILEGNIEAIIIVSIALAVVIGLFIHIYILPDRRWKPPSGPQERTHFYRKKKVAAEKEPPDAGL